MLAALNVSAIFYLVVITAHCSMVLGRIFLNLRCRYDNDLGQVGHAVKSAMRSVISTLAVSCWRYSSMNIMVESDKTCLTSLHNLDCCDIEAVKLVAMYASESVIAGHWCHRLAMFINSNVLPTVVGNRPPIHCVRMRKSQRTLVSMQRESFSQTIHCGVLNARSIGNKRADRRLYHIWQVWRVCLRRNMTRFSELSEYHCVHAIWLSMHGKSSPAINQGRDWLVAKSWRCLFHWTRYLIRPLTMPCYRSVEVLAVNIQGSEANIVIVVVYRSRSAPAYMLFFNEFADLMECSAALSVPVEVVSDENIHLYDPLLATSVKFNDIISGCDMMQLVTRPTHMSGHTLDVFINKLCRARPQLSKHWPAGVLWSFADLCRY